MDGPFSGLTALQRVVAMEGEASAKQPHCYICVSCGLGLRDSNVSFPCLVNCNSGHELLLLHNVTEDLFSEATQLNGLNYVSLEY